MTTHEPVGTRAVQYLAHPPKDSGLAEAFLTLECIPEDGVHHAVTVPRAWTWVAPLPVDPDPRAPQLASLLLEDPERKDPATILCGTLPEDWESTARAVVEGLAARDGMQPYRWNGEDDAAGGARAMVTDGVRVGAIRVLPLAGGGWVFVACIGPGARLADFGGALQNAMLSLRIKPNQGPLRSRPRRR